LNGSAEKKRTIKMQIYVILKVRARHPGEGISFMVLLSIPLFMPELSTK